MYRKYHGFLFLLPVLKANQPKTLVFTVFWQDSMQKNTMFSSNFSQFFSPCSSVQKTIIFYFIFATAYPQEGVKSGQIAKLHLNSTFWFVTIFDAKLNAVNYGVLWTYHAFYLQNKCPPPQLKLTVLVHPERHALLHLWCGRILHQRGSIFQGSEQSFIFLVCRPGPCRKGLWLDLRLRWNSWGLAKG